MARDTEVAEGIHLVKISIYENKSQVSIPKELRAKVGIRESCFLGVMALGHCVVMVPISDVTREGSEKEMAKEFESAVRAWERQRERQIA